MKDEPNARLRFILHSFRNHSFLELLLPLPFSSPFFVHSERHRARLPRRAGGLSPMSHFRLGHAGQPVVSHYCRTALQPNDFGTIVVGHPHLAHALRFSPLPLTVFRQLVRRPDAATDFKGDEQRRAGLPHP